MKTRLLNLLFLAISLTVLLGSCKKQEDVTEQYLRGGNSLVLSPDGNLVIAGYTTSGNKGYENAPCRI